MNIGVIGIDPLFGINKNDVGVSPRNCCVNGDFQMNLNVAMDQWLTHVQKFGLLNGLTNGFR